MASQAVGAGMNVALSSLLGGLGVSLLDEKGDIAASLKRTLTPESLRNALAAGLTAGIAHNLIASTEVLKSGGTAAAQAPSNVMKHIHHAALQASAETVVHSALQTKDPGEALKSAVLHGAAHALHATASNSLGANEATLGVLGHKAGHMLAATAASHIGSGGGDLKTSLIHGAAATLGHMLMSHMVDPDAEAAALKKAHPHLSAEERTDLLTKKMRGRQHLATITSAAFGGLFGGDVATAAHLAGTAITHNYMSSAVMDAARKHFGFGTPEKEDIGTKKVFEGEEGEDQNEGDLFYLREGAKERSLRSGASRSYAMGQTAAALDPRGAIAESLRFRTPGRQAPSSAFFTPTWQSNLSASSHRFERVMTEIESLKYAKSMWESTPEKRTFPVSKEDLEMRPRSNSASEQEMGNYFWALTEPPLEPETEAARAAEIRILEAQERVAQAQFDHEEASSTMEQLGAREELRDALDDLTRSRGDHFFVNPSESLLATRRAFEERNKPLASSLRQDIQETETFYKQNPHIQMTSEVKQHLFDLHETLEFVESAHTYIPVNVGQGIGTGIMVGTMVMPLGKGISEGSRQAAKAFSTASRGVKAAETKLARLSHYLKTRTGKATLLKDASGETQGAISHFDKVIQDLKTQFVQGAERKGIVDALGLEMGGLSRIKIETTRLQQGPPFYSKSYVDKHLKALRAESAADMTLERAGYKLYDAKLPGNKGFDNVAIKFGRQGEIEDILIGESKFVSKGKARLSKLKPIETPMGEVIPVVQMDDTWIERNIADMRKSTHPEIKELGNVLKENERLIRRKVSVTNPQSITQWGEKLHGVELPESQKFIDELARRANVQDD